MCGRYAFLLPHESWRGLYKVLNDFDYVPRYNITPTEPVVKWMAQLKAPYKQSVWFEHSAHMMQWEEPGKVLVSLLTYVRPLAKERKAL